MTDIISLRYRTYGGVPLFQDLGKFQVDETANFGCSQVLPIYKRRRPTSISYVHLHAVHVSATDYWPDKLRRQHKQFI